MVIFHRLLWKSLCWNSFQLINHYSVYNTFFTQSHSYHFTFSNYFFILVLKDFHDLFIEPNKYESVSLNCLFKLSNS